MWPYRDWVIKALNADMPFDRFTVEQIAGDMLPGATRDQRIATGFHRNAMTNEEGGVDPDEALYEVQVDRVNTTATVWLGSTVACAQCHNHKYDPFSQKDYYRLMAFFANPAFQVEKHGAGTKYSESQVDLATPEQEATRTQLRAELKAAEDAIAKDTPERVAAQARWEADVREAGRAWTPLVPRTAAATNGAQLTVRDDASVVASGPNPQVTTYTVEASSDAAGITGLRLEALLDPSLPKEGPGRDAYGHFRVTRVQVFAAPASDPAKRTRVDFKTVKGDGNVSRGDLLALTTDAPIEYSRLGKAWVVDAVRDGWRVPFQLVLVPKAPVGFPGGTVFTVAIGHEDGTLGQGMGRFRLSTTTAAAPLDVVAVSARTRAAIGIPLAARTETQAKDLATQFREQSSTFEAERKDVARLKKAIEDLKLPTTLVMEDKPGYERPSTPLRERGAFTSPGQRVYANTPSALPAMSDDLPPNRLGLARWLVSRDNPLTARVMVNRLWEALYGRGLVETSEDFGTMGAPPSHPELLDWLAVEFVEKGWSVKTMLRMLVLSADVPAGLRRGRRPRGTGPVQPAARPRTAVPDGGRDGARRGPGCQRQIEPARRRPERLPVAAAQHLGQPVRQLQVDREHGRGSLSPEPLHVPPPDGSVPDVHDFRRDQPRTLHGAARAHQYAPAGAGDLERPGLLRARPRACRPDAHRGAARHGGRADLTRLQTRDGPIAECGGTRTAARVPGPDAQALRRRACRGRRGARSREGREGRRRCTRSGGMDDGGQRVAEPRRDGHQGIEPGTGIGYRVPGAGYRESGVGSRESISG